MSLRNYFVLKVHPKRFHNFSLLKRFVAVNVRNWINRPSDMQRKHVSSHINVKRCPEVFTKKVHRKRHRQKKADERNYDWVKLVLKSQHRIRCQITQIHSFTILEHIGMFFAHQPTDVCEEKSPWNVVRIRVWVAIFVVNAVIAYPFDNAVLKCNRLKH